MNNTFFDARMKSLVIVVLAVLVLFLAVESIAALADIHLKKSSTVPTNVITARGSGEAVGTPDVAKFTFTVRETGKDVAAARDAMTDKAKTAIDYLKEKGVADKDIKTESYYTNPTYPACTMYSCPPSRNPTGYEVAETISVKVRDLAKAGDYLAEIANLKVGEVSALSFAIDDLDALKAEAKKDAIDKAKADAERTADALGGRLGRIVSFYEDYPYYGYDGGVGMEESMSSQKMMSVDMAPVPLEVGEQKVTASVSITYEIR